MKTTRVTCIALLAALTLTGAAFGQRITDLEDVVVDDANELDASVEFASAELLDADSKSGGKSTSDDDWRYRLFPVWDRRRNVEYEGRSCQPDDAGGITLRGWLSGGFTYNSEEPANRFNGPMGFNDRDDEFQLNQLYLSLESRLDENYDGLQFGFRTDLMFGTDARFTQAVGLELSQSSVGGVFFPVFDLNSGQRFYHLAFPQFYGEAGVGDWSMIVGHFYSPTGYERVQADENFFYSNSYTLVYGQPKTLTGAVAKWHGGGCLSFSLGVHNGWDIFTHQNNPINDHQGGLIEVALTDPDDRWSFRFTGLAGDDPSGGGLSPFGDAARRMYSMVGTYRVSDNIHYVIQHDAAYQADTVINEPGQWYSLINYLFFDLTDTLQAGIRHEIFDDDDALRVAAIDPFNPSSAGGYSGQFQQITLGLNWTPNSNVRIRPEIRWDWFDNHNVQNGLAFGDDGMLPFPAATENSQFTASVDAIILW